MSELKSLYRFLNRRMFIGSLLWYVQLYILWENIVNAFPNLYDKGLFSHKIFLENTLTNNVTFGEKSVDFLN